jgi:hypothetical protein
VLLVLGTPHWAVVPQAKQPTTKSGYWCSGANPCFAPPNLDNSSIRAAWTEWIRQLALRYPKAAGIEIWNEPNLRYFWFVDQDPKLYGTMLQSASQAVRGVNPSMPVLLGGLSNYSGGDSALDTDMGRYLQSVYANTAASSFNAISFHAYPCPGEAAGTRVTRAIETVRAVKQRNGDAGKPMWLTETGVTNGPGGAPANCGGAYREDHAASALAEVLRVARNHHAQHGDLPVALVHMLFDRQPRLLPALPNGSGDSEFGMISYTYNGFTRRTAIRPKPAWYAVRCAFRRLC